MRQRFFLEVDTMQLEDVPEVSNTSDYSETPSKPDGITKKRKPKDVSEKSYTKDKWQKLAQTKLEIAEEKRIQQEYEHDMAIANMAEQHKLKMRILQLKEQKLLLEIAALKK